MTTTNNHDVSLESLTLEQSTSLCRALTSWLNWRQVCATEAVPVVFVDECMTIFERFAEVADVALDDITDEVCPDFINEVRSRWCSRLALSEMSLRGTRPELGNCFKL